jgi:hypothetical protein
MKDFVVIAGACLIELSPYLNFSTLNKLYKKRLNPSQKNIQSYNFNSEMKFLVITLVLLSLLFGFSSSAVDIEPHQGVHYQGDMVLTPRQKLILEGGARTSNTGLLDLAALLPKLGGYVWVAYTVDEKQFSK